MYDTNLLKYEKKHIYWVPLTTSKNAKDTARCKWVLIVNKHFNIAFNDLDAKTSAHCNRVPMVTELSVSRNQCNEKTRPIHTCQKLGMCTLYIPSKDGIATTYTKQEYLPDIQDDSGYG